MKMLPIALGLSVMLASAPGAHAQTRPPEGPVLKAFNDFCVRAEGDEDRTLALAVDAGWRETDGKDLYAEGQVPAEMQFLRKSFEGVELSIAVRDVRGDVPEDPDIGLCSIIAYPTNAMKVFDPDPLDGLARWLGMFPHQDFTTDERDAYVFSVASDGTRASLAGRSDMAHAQAFLNGQARMVFAQMYEDQSVMLGYGVPRSRWGSGSSGR
jgi:hypothetical protein